VSPKPLRPGALVGAVLISALLAGLGVTPAWASAEQRAAWALAASTTDAARAEAARTQLPSGLSDDAVATPSPTESAAHESAAPTDRATPESITPTSSMPSDTATPTVKPQPTPTRKPAPTAAATGTIFPDAPSTIDAPTLGATIDFSGHEVEQTLAVAVSPLAASVGTALASETSATVLATPFAVSAETLAGKAVTFFPADPTILKVKNQPDVVTDVDPGVALDVDVTTDELTGIDPRTVRIVTRETAGEAWAEIPSYYDTATGSVKGEIDHLSQFAVIGTPFVVPAGPRVVLDPDDDVGHAGSSSELHYNVSLANQVAAQLTTVCRADVLVTRPTEAPRFLSSGIRAGMAAAFAPDITLTVAFNVLSGSPWGDEGDGGSNVYSRGNAEDNAAQQALVSVLPSYTTRPARTNTQASLPSPAFDPLPGAVVHLETLFLDHNYDRPIIENAFGFIASGVTTGIGTYLAGKGFNCVDPVTGGWPTRPSAAQIAQWKALGYHNYQTYGADPVSFSTGNLLESEPLFTLATAGAADIDLTLNYNSQDGRESRVGSGWSFGVGARAQRFIDGSALIVRGDGASDLFEPDGSGGYVAGAGNFSTLTESGGGRLSLVDASGSVWVFDAADIEGIGELVSFTDLAGNGYLLGYGAPGETERFVPLASITSTDGQVITVTNDATGHITNFTRPDGRTWSLGYSAAGDLTSITAPGTLTRSFAYDDTHRMLTATDAGGVTYLTNEFDADGRVIRQLDAAKNVRTFAYGAGTTTYTNNRGDDTIFAWDDQHRITKVTDALGGVEQFGYDAAGNTIRHSDQEGRVTRYEYDSRGDVTTETSPTGVVTHYTYTATGMLSSTTDGLGRTTVYDVNDRGFVTAAHLPDGSSVSLGYTAAGDLATLTDQAGKVTTFAGDTHGNVLSVTDALGQSTASTYDASGRLLTSTDASGATTSFEWNANDQLLRAVDALGAATSYLYDANGHVTSTTDALGKRTSYVWDDLFRLTRVTAPDGAVTRYGYNDEDDLTSITDPNGERTTLTVNQLGMVLRVTDAAGNRWSSSYDRLGEVLKATDPAGAITAYAYDKLGNTTKVTDATGAATTSAYDAIGRLASVTDALGGKTSYAYTLLDQLASITDESGAVTSFDYDAVGNQTATIDRRGQTWKQTYDALGRVTGQTDPTGGSTTFAYDTIERLVSTTDAEGETSVTGFDALGRVIEQTDPLGAVSTVAYDALGCATSTTDASGAVTKGAYDAVGNLVSLTNALGAVSTYGYDKAGRTTSATDPLGIVTKYSYDGLGNLTSVLENAGSSSSTDANVETKYAYTATGMLASTTDANGHATKYSYDARSQQTSVTNPLGIVSSATYDALGRTITATDGTGATTKTSYTARSDVAKIAYPDGVTVGFEYDTEQHPILMTDSLGTTGWSYDPAGRTIGQTDPNGVTITSAFDDLGRLTSKTIGNQRIDYGYDAAGRLVSQSSPGAALDYAYDILGNLTEEKRSSGVDTSYGYDAIGQLTSLVHQSPASVAPTSKAATVAKWNGSLAMNGKTAKCDSNAVAGYLAARTVPGTDISGCEKTSAYLDDRELPALTSPVPSEGALSFAYSYDASGNVTEQTEKKGAADAVTTTYSHDALNRLTGSASTAGATNSYEYDKVGNRTGWVSSSAPDTGKALSVASTFDAANELVSQSRTRPSGTTDVAYSYNANGNRTAQKSSSGAATAYAYTGAGRLASVTKGSQSTSYRYDGLGRSLETMVKSSVGAEKTTSAWDGLSVVQQSSSLTGVSTLVRDALGQVAVTASASGSSWSLQDRAGSTVAQTNAAGAVTDVVDYSDFGVPVYVTTGWSSSTGYTGEQTDATTGLNTYFARAYDPMAGTWLTADSYGGTLTDPTSQNRYGYAGANPTSNVDVLGFKKATPAWAHMSADALEREVMRNPTGSAAVAAAQATATVVAARQAKAVSNRGCNYVLKTPCGASGKYKSVRHQKIVVTQAQINLMAQNASRVGAELACTTAREYAAVGPCNDAEAIASNKIIGDGLATGADASDLAFSVCMADFANPYCGSFGTGASIMRSGTTWLRANSVARAIAPVGSLAEMFSAGPVRASELVYYAERQGWIATQKPTGPLIFVDELGHDRLSIKSGSARTPGSEGPHVEIWNEFEHRIDPFGNEVTKHSPGNHTPIEMDLK
jgi:RHS repeat-associated protein